MSQRYQQQPPHFQPYGGPTLQQGANSPNDLRQWQRGNLRNPPSWSPDVQSVYPFRHWTHDLLAWSVYIDLADERKGPVVELVLSGTARDLIREIPLDHKTRGIILDLGDGQGPRHRTGLEFIILVMSQHFSHLDDEESNRAMTELYAFRRQAGESMDAYLAR